jgi:hypothetical protein
MLDKKKVVEFRGEFAIAIQQLEKDFGVNISLGTISFNSNELRAKLTATVGDAVERPTRNDFRSGDIVWIDHKKIDKEDRFSIIKINNKNIKVQKIVDGGDRIGAFINVSPSLLRKA